MKTYPRSRRHERGQALVFVMLTATVSLTILASLMNRTATNSGLNDRNNRYFAAVSAAEAATEKVLSAMMWDYNHSGSAFVASRLNHYPALVPTEEEHTQWGRYQFDDGAGTAGRVRVEQVTEWRSGTPLISQYAGLSGYAADFRVASVARDLASADVVAGSVQQSFQLATIPVFQFAIFYNLDMEIHPGATMNVAGRVHSNQQIYSQPGAQLTFADDVTAAGQILNGKKEGDTTSRSGNSVTYQEDNDSGVNSLNLPLGTDNTPENVRKIIERPPDTEYTTSELGKQRFYNQVDLAVVVRDPATVGNPPVVEISGRNAGGINLATVSSFMTFTNASFYNKREQKTVKAIQLDVGALRTHVTGVNSIYVDDARTVASGTQPGLRVVNGRYLPNGGLTVATRLPLYVQGHYNAPATGTSDTSLAQPAALIGDAITVLSGNWNDANSTSGLSSRIATSTTVNAAFLAGIVETEPTANYNGYSGGVENFPRFLEDWGGKALHYNGSMVVMFESAIAAANWKGTGSSIGIYNPPRREWAFDQNFLDPTRLPPLTPEARTVVRGAWTMASACN